MSSPLKTFFQTLTFVNVISNPRIRPFVRAGERYQVARRRGASRTRDLELMAARIDLSPGVRRCRVQSYGFMADEVVTRFEARRDSVLGYCWALHDLLRRPRAAGTTFFLDFEPHGAGLRRQCR